MTVPSTPCADCGQFITNGHWYYCSGADGRLTGYYHSTCGDPLGIKAAVAAERERCAKIVDHRAAVWNEAVRSGFHGDCSMSLAEECEDIAAAIRKPVDK